MIIEMAREMRGDKILKKKKISSWFQRGADISPD